MIVIEVYASPNKKTKTGQRFRWRAVNAGNRRKMATGGEAYANAEDCIDAVTELFSTAAIYLRGGGSLVELRAAK